MTGAILETRGLVKRFGGVAAVDDVDFALAEGELRCLIGPNGAGKSTFFKMLSGQIQPTGGRIAFRGADITGYEPHAIAGLGVGIKTQVPNVFDGLSVRENLMLAAWRTQPRREAAATVEELLARVRLAAEANRPVGHLAHGQRQWVELGMVLARDPALVLLDEPTAGMTHEETAATADLIRAVNARCAIVVVEHDMQFVRMIATKVTVLHHGRVLAEDHVDVVMRDQRVRDVYLGRQEGRHDA